MARTQTRFRIPPPPDLPPVAAYALAVLLPLAALALERAFRPWVEHIPFVLFFLVVSLVASIGGPGPGLLAAVTSAACGYTFLTTSSHPERVAGALVGTALFLPVACLIAAIGALVRAGFREREAATGELAEAVRVREQFISTASHELKTPLTSLSLVVQQMARVRAGDAIPGAEQRLRNLQRHTERLARLVDDLLDVSRVTAGRLHLDIARFDLVEVVREVVARFDHDVARAGATIRVDAPAVVMGEWDRLRVDQIVTNLLSNAVKYGAGKPVYVSVSARGPDAVLVVADGGVGIASADQARIFERFERGAHAAGYGGFGLGLFIVREIVTALDGTVTVESAPQHGARFTVVLPAARRAAGARG
jgi:signal transduction histidine kinase